MTQLEKIGETIGYLFESDVSMRAYISTEISRKLSLIGPQQLRWFKAVNRGSEKKAAWFEALKASGSDRPEPMLSGPGRPVNDGPRHLV